ncbi:bacteriocin [Marinilactibacillus psychrotolerans]|uniref:Bacteriocin n=2 Tax=Marinilactibacillus psychrotolerans TaxID=191770 RepID=A0A5R9C4L0_9LACT|nr:bacteriocin [Marinilactibacillus psychrotolerans]TLQ07803.1 bacteriocin [Marinilactibacillus psychrotolerans]SJN23335.1 hypothetical protein FM115_02625 [Marinilactibacillus psychrotolerans 42ea]
MEIFVEKIIENKSIFMAIGIVILGLLAYAFYSPIFEGIYETGRDFGRSLVSLFMS